MIMFAHYPGDEEEISTEFKEPVVQEMKKE